MKKFYSFDPLNERDWIWFYVGCLSWPSEIKSPIFPLALSLMCERNHSMIKEVNCELFSFKEKWTIFT
jgi:hypothetical protein